MTVLAVNAKGCDPVPASPLHRALEGLAPGTPVTILLHGFRYTPDQPDHDPHRFIFAAHSDEPVLRNPSWPRHLGYGRGKPGGLCIGFGWNACGTIWRANDEALRAGVALATLIGQLRAAGMGPVNILAHSLGARVALAALAPLCAGDVGRIIFLTGAEYRSVAETALATPAGQAAEVLNITSRENDLFDFLYESSTLWRGPTLGAGLDTRRCVTLQIDHTAHCEGLRVLGYPTAAPKNRICHWSSYLRPGLFPLYRAFLREPQSLPLELLRAHLPTEVQPRWSRLLARPVGEAGVVVQ